MKIVNIEVLPANDGEVVTAVITEETKKGGSWQENSKNTVESGTPDAKRSVRLDDDDRVVIEGKVEAQVELDSDQRAAKKTLMGDKAKEQKKKDEERSKRIEEQDKKEKEELERSKPEEAKLRAEQQKQRDEKIMGKQDDKEKQKSEEERKSGSRKADEQPQPTQGPTTQGPRDAGLRHETPTDSKTVTDHGSTTKPKK